MFLSESVYHFQPDKRLYVDLVMNSLFLCKSFFVFTKKNFIGPTMGELHYCKSTDTESKK